MSSTLFSLLMAPALGAPALPDVKTPPGPAPTACIVSKIDAVKGELELMESKQVPVTEYRTVQKQIMQNGQVVIVTEAVPVTVIKNTFVTYRVAIKGHDAMDAAGKKIGDIELAKRIKEGDTILRSSGATVDAAWLKVLKPETVILLSKDQPTGAPAVAPVDKQP